MGMEKVTVVKEIPGGTMVRMMMAAQMVGAASVGVYGEGAKPQGVAVPTAAAARQMTEAKLKIEQEAQELAELYEDTEAALMAPINELAQDGYSYHAAIIDDRMVEKFVPALKAAGYKVLLLPPNCDGCRQIPADIRDEVREEMCDEIMDADVGTETLVIVRW